ncbi:hypothetical protein CN926_08910, partial [Bacillus thuringiensis]|uniref:hypothetical protein n=1 Tax=Bacillus thuringiensis TaxID=1428 RepID=UPI000BFBEFA5
IIGREEKEGILLSQGNLLFPFYGAMHFFIQSYYIAFLGFSFVTGLPEKLYKIMHTLSVLSF